MTLKFTIARQKAAALIFAVATAAVSGGNDASAGQGVAPSHAALTEQLTSRIVVKYRDAAPAERMTALSAGATARESSGAQRANYPMRRLKVTASGAVVYHLGQDVSLAQAEAAAARIAQDPSVEYAEPDVRVKTMQSAPVNDPYFSYQWPLMASSTVAGGSNFVGAWAISKGTGVLVGVVDTGGFFSQPDLEGQQLNGYDFVSAEPDGTFATAGDGDGRDYDATDPGDFCADTRMPSDWHGTSIAGVIAATANNSYGIAGAAPNAKVLQLRAVGRCFGYLTDVADALTWGAGAPVAGVAANTKPAQVINLSLGAAAGTTCYTYMQEAVNAAITRNVSVVVAAGNEALNDVGAPANCTGVIAVAAHTKSGDLADYSNRSPAVTLTAPGGGLCELQTKTCLNDTIVTVGVGGGGARAEGGSAPRSIAGTSTAAPHVAATVALIKSVAPNLTPNEIKALLIATAKAHPADSYCYANPADCGAGMLDAQAAVNAAVTPVLLVKPSYIGPFVAGNQTVSLTGAVSVGMGSSYQWEQVSGTPVTLTGANTSSVSFKTPTAGGILVFRVNALTSMGAALTLKQTVVVNSPPVLTSTAFSILSGRTLTAKLVASDADGDAVAFNLVSGPVGLTLQGDTLNYFSGIGGDFPVVVDMLDARGARSRSTAIVTVTLHPIVSDSKDKVGAGSSDLVFLCAVACAVLGVMQSRR